MVFLSAGILNSNETPNRSIKAGAWGSNPTQIGVKSVFYLFFFSPDHYSNSIQRVVGFFFFLFSFYSPPPLMYVYKFLFLFFIFFAGQAQME